MLIHSFVVGFEGSCGCDAVEKCYPTFSFLLLTFILIGISVNPYGLGHKANSD